LEHQISYGFGTEWVVIVVTLLIGIQEVLSFILGQETRILTDVFHGFPWSIQADAKIMPELNHDSLHLNSLHFIIRLTIWRYII
jgi:hypothetical protein